MIFKLICHCEINNVHVLLKLYTAWFDPRPILGKSFKVKNAGNEHIGFICASFEYDMWILKNRPYVCKVRLACFHDDPVLNLGLREE